MTISQLCTDARRKLEAKFASGEAQALVREMMERIKGYSQVDLIMNGDKEAGEFLVRKVGQTVEHLLASEPIQYIFGRAHFYGLDFIVSPAVLIPRPETAELVDYIVKRYSSQSDLRVLDLCTGSGCIACTLARNLPFSEVTAADVSADALDIARKNASELKVKIRFIQEDILKWEDVEKEHYDIIVSNPPYIADSERSGMEANVIDHEPHLALFVPDDDPLKFYKAISRISGTALKPGATLWFEINPNFAKELRNIMNEDGWEDVTLTRDTSGKIRFLNANQPS